MKLEQAQLDELVRRIVEAVHPLKIILFGSAARGEMGPDSDVDLMVVMPEGTHLGYTAEHIYLSVRGVGIPYDVVVATPGDIEKHRDTPWLIYRDVAREGRTVYAA